MPRDPHTNLATRHAEGTQQAHAWQRVACTTTLVQRRHPVYLSRTTIDGETPLTGHRTVPRLAHHIIRLEDTLDEDIILGGLSILFGGLVVLVPVLGFTLRLAIKPFFDTWAEIQRGRGPNDHTALLERQVELLESELQQVQQVLGSLVEAQEFQRKLTEPAQAERVQVSAPAVPR